jgi:hypothetical protein
MSPHSDVAYTVNVNIGTEPRSQEDANQSDWFPDKRYASVHDSSVEATTGGSGVSRRDTSHLCRGEEGGDEEGQGG